MKPNSIDLRWNISGSRKHGFGIQVCAEDPVDMGPHVFSLVRSPHGTWYLVDGPTNDDGYWFATGHGIIDGWGHEGRFWGDVMSLALDCCRKYLIDKGKVNP